jgi:hypothetical protein
MLSALEQDVDARGSLRFMVIEGTFNADRLIAGREKPVFLIVDGHPALRAQLF